MHGLKRTLALYYSCKSDACAIFPNFSSFFHNASTIVDSNTKEASTEPIIMFAISSYRVLPGIPNARMQQ
jgi:hypothetical protein